MEFDWGGFGLGVLVGFTAVFGWGAISLGNGDYNDGAVYVFTGLFIAGCALVGGLS